MSIFAVTRICLVMKISCMYSKDCVEIVFVFKLIVIDDKTVIVVLEL